jgi:hypothetical protein
MAKPGNLPFRELAGMRLHAFDGLSQCGPSFKVFDHFAISQCLTRLFGKRLF